MKVEDLVEEETRNIGGVEYIRVNGVWKQAPTKQKLSANITPEQREIQKSKASIKRIQKENAEDFKLIDQKLNRLIPRTVGDEELRKNLEGLRSRLNGVRVQMGSLWRDRLRNLDSN